MAVEFDPEKIVHLALIPVGATPDTGHRGYGWAAFRQSGLHHHFVMMCHRVQVVYDLELAVLLDVVDHGKQSQIIKSERRVIF